VRLQCWTSRFPTIRNWLLERGTITCLFSCAHLKTTWAGVQAWAPAMLWMVENLCTTEGLILARATSSWSSTLLKLLTPIARILSSSCNSSKAFQLSCHDPACFMSKSNEDSEVKRGRGTRFPSPVKTCWIAALWPHTPSALDAAVYLPQFFCCFFSKTIYQALHKTLNPEP